MIIIPTFLILVFLLILFYNWFTLVYPYLFYKKIKYKVILIPFIGGILGSIGLYLIPESYSLIYPWWIALIIDPGFSLLSLTFIDDYIPFIKIHKKQSDVIILNKNMMGRCFLYILFFLFIPLAIPILLESNNILMVSTIIGIIMIWTIWIIILLQFQIIFDGKQIVQRIFFHKKTIDVGNIKYVKVKILDENISKETFLPHSEKEWVDQPINFHIIISNGNKSISFKTIHLIKSLKSEANNILAFLLIQKNVKVKLEFYTKFYK